MSKNLKNKLWKWLIPSIFNWLSLKYRRSKIKYKILKNKSVRLEMIVKVKNLFNSIPTISTISVARERKERAANLWANKWDTAEATWKHSVIQKPQVWPPLLSPPSTNAKASPLTNHKKVPNNSIILSSYRKNNFWKLPSTPSKPSTKKEHNNSIHK